MYRISGAYQRLQRYFTHLTICQMPKRNQTEGKMKQATSHPDPEPKIDIPETMNITSATSLPEVDKLSLQSTYVVPETKAVLDVAKQREEMLKLATSFDEMPGPLILKYLARGWSYLPQLSNQFTAAAMVYFMNMLGASLVWNRGVSSFAHMFDKYGPVVRLQGIFGGDIVFVTRPEHIETVYREEGKFPLRSALDSLEKYRTEHRKQSISGPFVMYGPDWESLRPKLEVPFSKSVSQFGPQLEVIADDFMANLKALLNRQEETPANFHEEIFKWAFESVALVTLGKRMHLMGSQKLLPDSVGYNLLDAMQNASGALRKCESGFQLWRFFKTPAWKNLVSSCETIDSSISKFIKETESRLAIGRSNLSTEDTQDTEARSTALKSKDLLNRPTSLLESLQAGGGMSADDILTVVLDTLLLGTNATAHALSFLLYRLAKNPRLQRNLHEELVAVMPERNTPISLLLQVEARSPNRLEFLRACLRESLRMNPPIPVLTRILPKDIALHNYRVPKGTMVLMTTHVAGLKEENFEDARKYVPERWLEGDSHPFAALPYGHGPRSCVARHLADVQILLLAAKIFRAYNVEYNYGVMQSTNRLIAMPNKPLKFQFIERT